MKRICRWLLPIFAAAAGAGLLCGCTAADPITRTAVYLDTTVSVTLYDTQDEALLNACMQHIAQREALWSRTVETSDIARINAADGATVTVATETAQLLLTAQMYAQLTDGALDVTIAPLTDLWEKAVADGVEPTEEALAATAAAVDAARLQIDGCAVTADAGQALDLGGIAKGAIADELSELLRENGCESALIDLGGNIFAHGTRPDGKPFRVGIVDPRDTAQVIAAVEVQNGSVVTSGSYERQYLFGERAYSHILDPKTGQPIENGLLSVTILSPHSVDGDALSTACFVMGLEKAKALVESYSDVEAVFVTADGEVVSTAGVTLL